MMVGAIQLTLIAGLAALLLCGAQPLRNALPSIGMAPAPGPIPVGRVGLVPLGPLAAAGPEDTVRRVCKPDYEKELKEQAAFSYATSGMTWDLNKDWVCTTGQKQSPINVPLAGALEGRVPDKFRIRLGKVTATDAVLRVLPILEVQLLGNFTMDGFQVPVCNITASPPDVGCLEAGPTAVPVMVNVTAKNLHFHAVSEHAHAGRLYPLEAHMVTRIPNTTVSTCPPSGCFVVFSQMFSFGFNGETNPFLDAVLPALQERGQSCNPIDGPVNVTSLFTTTHSYMTYRGSLTTPPCIEGITWVLLNTPVMISPEQQMLIQNAMAGVRHEREYGVRTNNRPIQPLNNRTILFSADPVAAAVAPV